MTQVTIHEAKTNLSKLLALVEAGEEVIIARRSTPIAKLTALPKPQQSRCIGGAPGFLVYMADDFDEPLEDFADYM